MPRRLSETAELPQDLQPDGPALLRVELTAHHIVLRYRGRELRAVFGRRDHMLRRGISIVRVDEVDIVSFPCVRKERVIYMKKLDE